MGTATPVLQVGFARVEVTPPPGIPYLSYFPRQTAFAGVHDPLQARALAAELGPVRVAVVAVDALGFSRSILGPGQDFVADVRARIERQTGIPAGQVLLSATHAHSTPQTTDIAPLVEAFPAAREWLERLAQQIAAAVTLAWAGRAPAEVRGATGLAPGIAWSRRILTRDGRLMRFQNRPPETEIVKEARDDRVPVLLIRDLPEGTGGGEGPPRQPTVRGAVIGFTCHPTTVQVQPLVSADYPGVACDVVERSLPVSTCLFLQGACGDVNPVRGTTDFADAARYGKALGGEALRLLTLLDGSDRAAMAPALAVGSEIVEVERRALPDGEALARQASVLAAQIEAAPDGESRQAAIGAFRRVAEPLRLAQLGKGPVPVEVQAIRLGDALFVACAGELFVEYGNRIKEHSPASVTFVAGYANGYEGYLPTPETFDEGGYEAAAGPWTRVGRFGGETLAGRAMAIARQVWDAGGAASMAPSIPTPRRDPRA
jgi:hypothetical protein